MTSDPVLLPFERRFEGERVMLRAWEPDDAPALYGAIAANREHLRRWMPWTENHGSVEQTRAYILHAQVSWILREVFDMGIWGRESGELYGAIGISSRGWQVPAFEIGYWLRADVEGRGYITEAARLLTDYLFERQGAQRVQIRCDARNVRSAAVARRLGYTLEGVHRSSARATDGSLEDMMVFARVAAESAE